MIHLNWLLYSLKLSHDFLNKLWIWFSQRWKRFFYLFLIFLCWRLENAWTKKRKKKHNKRSKVRMDLNRLTLNWICLFSRLFKHLHRLKWSNHNVIEHFVRNFHCTQTPINENEYRKWIKKIRYSMDVLKELLYRTFFFVFVL